MDKRAAELVRRLERDYQEEFTLEEWARRLEELAQRSREEAEILRAAVEEATRLRGEFAAVVAGLSEGMGAPESVREPGARWQFGTDPFNWAQLNWDPSSLHFVLVRTRPTRTWRVEAEFWTDLARENGIEGLPSAVRAGIRSVAQRGSFERVWGEIAPRYPAVTRLALRAYNAGA